MCYNMQINIWVFGHVPLLITWFICQIIVDCLNPIVFACVLNQFVEHWFLSNAFNFAN
jgi:hypothetical protein